MSAAAVTGPGPNPAADGGTAGFWAPNSAELWPFALKYDVRVLGFGFRSPEPRPRTSVLRRYARPAGRCRLTRLTPVAAAAAPDLTAKGNRPPGAGGLSGTVGVSIISTLGTT